MFKRYYSFIGPVSQGCLEISSGISRAAQYRLISKWLQAKGWRCFNITPPWTIMVAWANAFCFANGRVPARCWFLSVSGLAACLPWHSSRGRSTDLTETGDEQDYGPPDVPLMFSWFFRRKQRSILHLQLMLTQLLLISEGKWSSYIPYRWSQ